MSNACLCKVDFSQNRQKSEQLLFCVVVLYVLCPMYNGQGGFKQIPAYIFFREGFGLNVIQANIERENIKQVA